MSFTSIRSVQILGINPIEVFVEIDISKGIYNFQIVGLANKSVEESKERVMGALKNSLSINPKSLHEKITVSLSPAEIKKDGSYFDLAIAIGYLKSTNKIKYDTQHSVFIGELSLNGEIKKVRGVIPILIWAQKQNIKEIFIPEENRNEIFIKNKSIKIFPIKSLKEVFEHLEKIKTIKPFEKNYFPENIDSKNNLEEIKGQEQAKRALAIAASGGHNIVLYGPPGTGKSMLAKAFHSILPKLSDEDFLEVASIYSSIGKTGEILNKKPPIRSPHHSASSTSIIGGGSNLNPGEITLSHKGVLFLDEFPEFDRKVIESLREPMEEKKITISRARGSITYPASCIILATMNPCPCGYKGSTAKECICSQIDIIKYRKKISGPIMDRIDIWVSVQNIKYEDLHADTTEVGGGEDIKKIIKETIDYQKNKKGKLNSELTSKELFSLPISNEAKNILQMSSKKLLLSPRAYTKIIKVAKTISDISKSEKIETEHILEALQYRPKLD